MTHRAASALSRRRIVRAAGLMVASALVPLRASGQPQPVSDGFRVLRARPGHALLQGAGREATPIWGYDGGVPGPILRVKRGEELKVRLVNELAADTTIHWHGIRAPNAFDGVAPLTQRPVAPGASFDYRFTPPDAGTYWYRAPFRSQQNRALYGPLIVDEAEPADVDRDVALMLDAWPSGDDGPSAKDAAPLATVNGLPTLDLPVVTNERVRLRLINAALDRFVTLRLDRHVATVVAIDGQPAEPFLARESRITLSPGNRVDLILDAVLEGGRVAPIVAQIAGADVPLARFVYETRAPSRPAPRTEIKPLPRNALPERMDFRGALRGELPLLEGDARGGSVPGVPLFSVKHGRTVTLAIANRTEAPHALHIHGHSVRLLDNLDDGWKPFWLDTILSVPRQTTRVAFVADNPGKWLLHSRAVDAEGGTISWFEVI